MRKALTRCERVNAKAIARCGVAGARSAHRYIKALERRPCRERVLSRLARTRQSLAAPEANQRVGTKECYINL
jgi:hypothetical protein